MIYIENHIPEKYGYVLPIGDLHFGDEAFKERSFKKLTGYIKWVKEHPNARVVFGGDLFNVATRISVTSPFEQRKGEFEKVIKLFEPIKTQIAGAIDGNHEFRLIDFANFSLMNEFCVRLGIPYMGISGVINFKVHKKRSLSGGQWQQNYYIYFHHTTGGGGTAGGKLNRAEKLRYLVENCDAYCGFHGHSLTATPKEIWYPNPDSKKVELRRYWLICCGGYLSWDGSYAERGMLPPEKLGSPRLRLDGLKHDLHVNL